MTIVPDLLTIPTAELAVGLLIGGGCAGAAIVGRLSGFGCSMLYSEVNWLSAETERDLCLDRASLVEISEKSDFVISACPLTEETKHLVNADFLAQMKPSSILINISRGSVVDEETVAGALEGGRLAWFVADVFEMEDWVLPGRPKVVLDRLLKQVEKTLFTPHIGSAVDRVRLEIAIQAASAIGQYLEGKQSDQAVNVV